MTLSTLLNHVFPFTRKGYIFIFGWEFVLIAAMSMSQLLHIIEKYLWSDWEFAAFLALVVGIDTITGMLKAFKTKTFESKKGLKGLWKIAGYALCLITLHAAGWFLTRTSTDTSIQIIAEFVKYFDAVVYGMIMFNEIISITENLHVLGIKALPSFVSKRIKAFDEKGDIKSLTETPDGDNDNK